MYIKLIFLLDQIKCWKKINKTLIIIQKKISNKANKPK